MRSLRARTSAAKTLLTFNGPFAFTERSPWYQRSNLPFAAVVTRLMLPTLEKLGEAYRRKHAKARCMTVLLALERYRLRKGRWPTTLGELAPDLLPAIPLDPYDGRPLRYRLTGGGVVVYSVGADETDNGGALNRQSDILPGTDVGFELWDVELRRLPAAPPMPPRADRP